MGWVGAAVGELRTLTARLHPCDGNSAVHIFPPGGTEWLGRHGTPVCRQVLRLMIIPSTSIPACVVQGIPWAILTEFARTCVCMRRGSISGANPRVTCVIRR